MRGGIGDRVIRGILSGAGRLAGCERGKGSVERFGWLEEFGLFGVAFAQGVHRLLPRWRTLRQIHGHIGDGARHDAVVVAFASGRT